VTQAVQRGIPVGDAEVIRSLPHWPRVAFAARCGRACLPLFRAAWPGAPPEQAAAVVAAIEVAEQSAAAGVAAGGAKSAALEACSAAGAALMAAVPQSALASLAAKPAEFAARSVAAGPDGSAEAAAKGYGFALQAAWEAGEDALTERLADDLARLSRVAAAGGWIDATPVPPTVFGLLSGD
jgi:hypothetical protein